MIKDVFSFWLSLIGKVITWIFSVEVWQGTSLGMFFIYFAVVGLIIWLFFDMVLGGDE